MNFLSRWQRGLLVTILCVGLAGILFFAGELSAARDQSEINFLPRQSTFNAAKIDDKVQSELSRSGSAVVLILGETQLLETPLGYQEFIETHAELTRSELRTMNISKLKEIASSEQSIILEKLGNPEGTQSVWLVNAIIASLSEAQVHAASLVEEVKYIYPGDFLAADRTNPGSVRSIINAEDPGPFSTTGKQIPWNLERVGASRVWSELGVTGEGIVIAAIDSGVNYLHSDLTNNIWINQNEIANNGIDDDRNGFIDDIYGYNFGSMRAEVGVFGNPSDHGTWVAGILVGDGSGGIITGVAPRAKVMPLQIRGVHTAILAHQYALEMGADVINMSFSIPDLGDSRGIWRLMAEQAEISGLVLVSGAGNFQQSAQIPVQLRIPEGIPSVIAAGGVDQSLNLASFSSTGPVEWESVKFYEDHPELIKPDVVAFPGAGYPVLNTAADGYIDPNNSVRGNSFSGPHVSGTAALILSANPELPAWRVKEILETTAEDIAPSGKDNLTGAGLIDAYQAVLSVMFE